MKNIERIRQMSTWELGEFIHGISCGYEKITTCEKDCCICDSSDGFCIFQICEWLNTDV